MVSMSFSVAGRTIGLSGCARFSSETVRFGIAQIPLLDHLVIGATGSANGQGYISIREYSDLEWQTAGRGLVSEARRVDGSGRFGGGLRDAEAIDQEGCTKCDITKSEQKFIECLIKPME